MRLAYCFLLVPILVACGEVVPDPGDDAGVDPCAAPNVCECSVATVAADCAAHEVCEESATGRQCACAAGYADQGGACVFQGAPLDPGMMDPTKWTAVGDGVIVEPAATGNVDVGEAVFSQIGMCNGGGLRQTVAMPPLDRAEPFKLRVTHKLVDESMFGDLTAQTLSVGIGTQFFDFVSENGVYRTDTVCLGASAYGGDREFRIATDGFSRSGCGVPTEATVNIDRVAVEVATPSECPAPNTVVDGDFDLPSAWTFQVTQNATGAIAANGGENNSRSARLTTANKCSQAQMTGTVAFPGRDVVPNPAIEVLWSGSSKSRLSVLVDGKAASVLAGDGGAAKRSRICVPDWAVGTTTTLAFFLQRTSDNGCATARATAYNLDSIKIVNETSCAAEVLADPGFERIANLTGPMPGWGLTNGYVNDNEGARAEVINDAIRARTGTGVLLLTGSHECVHVGSFGGSGGADTTFIVPRSSGNAGPAVRFFANVGANNLKTTTRVSLLVSSIFQNPNFDENGQLGQPPDARVIDLPETGAYQRHTLCLPPTMAGRRMTARFTTADSDGGGCGANYAEETALIDDVELTTDPSCPAQ